MPSILKIPKLQLTLALFLISLTAIVKNFSLTSLSVILMALAFSISFDLIFLYLRKVDLFVPYAAIVSGFIIGLIIDPQASWYQIALTAFFAMGFKNFLRLQQKHIFNPAGSGLIILGLFAQSISWWGVSFQTIPVNLNLENVLSFAILLSPLLVSAVRMKRHHSILAFLISYALFFSILNHTSNLNAFLETALDPTTIFFAIVMVPEPITSPVAPVRQILYGSFIGLAVFTLSFFSVRFLPDPLLPALLLGNLLFFKFR